MQIPEPAGGISRLSTKSSITCSQQSCAPFVLLYLNRVIRFSQLQRSDEEEARRRRALGSPFEIAPIEGASELLEEWPGDMAVG